MSIDDNMLDDLKRMVAYPHRVPEMDHAVGYEAYVVFGALSEALLVDLNGYDPVERHKGLYRLREEFDSNKYR